MSESNCTSKIFESMNFSDSVIKANLILPNKDDFKKRPRSSFFKNCNSEFLALCDTLRNVINQQQPTGTLQSPNSTEGFIRCSVHANKKASFVCAVPNCPVQFYSHSAINAHSRRCSHIFNFLNIFDLQDLDELKNYFDHEHFAFEAKKNEIRAIFQELKRHISAILDDLCDNAITRLISGSKEFRQQRLVNELTQNYDASKRNSGS